MKKRSLALVLFLALCLALAVPAAAAPANDYAPYTFKDQLGDPVFCSAARAEKKSVQIRTKETLIGGAIEFTPYQEEAVTLVTLKPGSSVTVSLSPSADAGMDCAAAVVPSGKDQFVRLYEDTSIYWLDNASLQRDLKNGGVLVTGKDTDYLLIYEDVLSPAVSFADVPDTSFCADAVKWAVQRGITTGTTSSTFSPNTTCTVAQITTFLYRAYGSPEAAPGGFYDDVRPTDWYVDASNWAYAAGLSVGHFGGNDPCTRAMAVTYLWLLAGSPDAGDSGFSDVPAGTFYSKAVAWAVKSGITSGTGSGKFSPDTVCTRGQIVTFLYRFAA